MKWTLRWLSLVAIAVCMPRLLWAQIDPYPGELIELGYHKELNGHAPLTGYLYYYRNVPQFVQSNLALRVVVSPVYVDGELGIRDVLGPHTGTGFGLAGTTIHPDQLSAYRLGGLLDLTAEFPYRRP